MSYGAIILYLILAWILYLIGRIIYTFVREYFKMRQYKKQGLKVMTYNPFIGYVLPDQAMKKQHGDVYYKVRTALVENPNEEVLLSNLMGEPTIFLCNPKLIEEFMNEKSQYYVKKELEGSKLFIRLFGRGLITLEGDIWKKHRRIVSEAFHFEFLQKSFPILLSSVESNLKRIKDTSQVSEGKYRFNLLDNLQMMTGDVVCRTFFGQNYSETTIEGRPIPLFLINVTKDLFKPTLANTLSLIFGPAILDYGIFAAHRKLKRDMNQIKNLARQVINERRQKGLTIQDRKDLMQCLLEHNEKNPGDMLTDDEIIGEFLIFFLAGMDTTAHLVLNALYFASQHPEYSEQLRKEFAQFDSVTDLNTLNKMTFTDAFLKESLRLIPPVSFLLDREATEDHYLGKYFIKRGTQVGVPILSLNNNPQYYPDPTRFDPTRWLKEGGDKVPFRFLPFSAGKRNCIGKHLAMMESKIIMWRFYKEFKTIAIDEDFKLVLDMKGSMYESENPIMAVFSE